MLYVSCSSAKGTTPEYAGCICAGCDVGTENFAQAMKLAERTIQFADTLTILTDGYIKAGRVSHAEGVVLDATRHFTEAMKAPVINPIAAIGLAQIQMKTGKALAGRRMVMLY